MVNLQKAINQDFLDNVMPSFGNARKVNTPNYGNSQKMFIFDEYESAAGHYYRGIRFCDCVVFAELVDMYHNWTYIDSLEFYVFNGEKLVLVQKKDYGKVIRKGTDVKADSEAMLRDRLGGQAKMAGTIITDDQLQQRAYTLVACSYISLLDKDFGVCFTKILPALDSANNTNNNKKILR